MAGTGAGASSPSVVTSDPEVSRFVLQSDARAFVPWYPRSLTELMGKSSILLINGSLQRRVHGLVGAFFKSPQLKAQVTADMQRRVGRAMDTWSKRHHRSMSSNGGGALPVRVQDEARSVRDATRREHRRRPPRPSMLVDYN